MVNLSVRTWPPGIDLHSTYVSFFMNVIERVRTLSNEYAIATRGNMCRALESPRALACMVPQGGEGGAILQYFPAQEAQS